MKAVEQGLLVSTLCMSGFGVYYIIMYQLMIFTLEAPLTWKWFSGRSCIQSNQNFDDFWEEGKTGEPKEKPVAA